MASSLVRFMNRQKDGNGQQLSWHRATLDGAPFRGPPPMFTGEEFEERVARVADPKVDEFDISRPEEKKAYLMVLEGAANHWFRILYIKRPGEYDPKRRTVAYVEWLEFYMEDGTRTPFMSPGVMEVGSGTPGMAFQG